MSTIFSLLTSAGLCPGPRLVSLFRRGLSVDQDRRQVVEHRPHAGDQRDLLRLAAADDPPSATSSTSVPSARSAPTPSLKQNTKTFSPTAKPRKLPSSPAPENFCESSTHSPATASATNFKTSEILSRRLDNEYSHSSGIRAAGIREPSRSVSPSDDRGERCSLHRMRGDQRSQPVVGDSSGFALLIVIRVDSGSHHKLTTGGPAVGGTA